MACSSCGSFSARPPDGRIALLTTFRKQRNNERQEIDRARRARRRVRETEPLKETKMANYSRWDDVKKGRSTPTTETRVEVEHDLALGQLIYDLRTEAGFSQRQLAERMHTTQSVISRLEERAAGPGTVWTRSPV
jgi:ribosome-binding protein aMBF1 (putative translation factor)